MNYVVGGLVGLAGLGSGECIRIIYTCLIDLGREMGNFGMPARRGWRGRGGRRGGGVGRGEVIGV